MRKELSRLLVTGGAGFIGSHFTRLALRKGFSVAVVDRLTYAGDLSRLKDVSGSYKLFCLDVCDEAGIERLFRSWKPQAVAHFAAETHVDRSIQDAAPFIRTNIKGTQVLLDAARRHGVRRFIHISSDEVYGEILRGSFKEDSPLSPNSPYAVSKAAADLLVRAHARTYRIPVIIVRPSNNYGPWQYPEKLIPVTVVKAMHQEKVPVYANGLNKREWLHVEDCCEGILTVLQKGSIGQAYNLGSGDEERNIDVVKKILTSLGRPLRLVRYVPDRPGHDYRYRLDSSKVQRLGWRPRIDFESGLEDTVAWYVRNADWLEGKLTRLRKYWKKAYR